MSPEDTPENNAPTARKLLRKGPMMERVPLSYPKIWRMMRDDEFPKPVKLGNGKNAPVAWYEDEIIEVQKSLERVEYKPADEPVAEDEAA